jgi:hypothetical protein
MAAVNGLAASEDAFDHLVRQAQDRLRRAEELARLAQDPATDALGALSAHLDVLAGHHRLEKERVNARLEVVDDRLDEVHQIHAELSELTAATATAARAEIGKAQAEIAREAAQQIAGAAAQQLKAMTRTLWLRAVTAAVAVGMVTFVTGGVLGFAWGAGSTASTVASADAALRFVAHEEGAAAIKDWEMLMRDNPIEALMAGCSGSNVASQGGRKACRMWLWIEPPKVTLPKTAG